MIPFLEDSTAWHKKGAMDLMAFREKRKPRIFKTHQAFNCDLFPCQLGTVWNPSIKQCLCPNCARHYKRVIYIYRNGKATLASYFRFRKGLGHLRKRAYGMFMNQRRMYPGMSWADHIRSWKHAESLGEVEILWIAYERLQSHAEVEMARIAAFLGYDKVGPDEIRFAITASSKKKMAQMEAEGDGIDFFKKRYKGKQNLKFVDSVTSDELSTENLWNAASAGERAVWKLHNDHVQSCLGYETDPNDDN